MTTAPRRKSRLLRAIGRMAQWNAFRAMLLGGIAVSCVMLAIFGITLHNERHQALAHARQHAQNLALIVEKDLARNFELYDLSLQAIVDNWNRPDITALPLAVRRLVLFDRSSTARHIMSAAVINANGRIELSLRGLDTGLRRFDDREWFTVHRDSATRGLYLSKPAATQVTGTTNVALSRRLSQPDGSFAGVAVIFLDVGYFHELLTGLDIGPHGRTSIVTGGGTLVMTEPYVASLIGDYRGSSPIFKRMSQARSTSFLSSSPIDGRQRLFVIRTVEAPELKVLMALDTEDIYAPWREQALPTAGAAAAFAIGLVVLSGLLGRQLQRRRRAEEAMRLMANTDGLTGLCNRRALDRILANETSRARRGSEGLCIVFIDVDYFKRFNDTQGHPAGDRVLAAVAQTLTGAIKRPGDHAGRYGGEEFMVVLAQTDIAGARRVAEKIRRSVEGLAIPHPDSPMGVVTVSIGVAASVPQGASTVHDLVGAADAALYRAKNTGRNRVEVFDTLAPPALAEPVPTS
jgi:diguanylate cyclase (GGDEF)-like protein